MKFIYWEKGRLKRIYINGVSDFSGKCFLTKKGKVAILQSDEDLSLENKEQIYSTLELGYGIPRGELVFDEVADAIKQSKPQPKSYSPKAYGMRASGDRDKEAENLDILSIDIPEPVKVVIDHREPEALKKLLTSHPNIEVTIASLDLGDFIINDTIIIERKDCSKENQSTDFEQSIIEKDKRLFNQSERLKLQDDYIPIVLLEGSCYNNSQRMLVQQIDGAISFLAVVQKLSVINSFNQNHTAYIIAKLATHSKNGLGYDLGLRAQKPELLLDKKSFVLEGIPGISPKIARELLSHFGSVKEIVNATEKELLQVKGLGKKRVKDILSVLS